MKRSLTDWLHVDHPLANVEPLGAAPGRSPAKNAAIAMVQRLLARKRLRLVRDRSSNTVPDYRGLGADERRALRTGGLEWPARAHTMIGLKRLDHLQHCVETVIAENIPGDFIETGVWRGGATIFMRAALAAYGETARTVWVADSFAGLPPPDPSTYPMDTGDTHHRFKELAVSLDEVKANFAAYGLLDGQVRFLEGWFSETLAQAPIGKLAIARLDGDMYASTIQALDALYPKVSAGGFIIIDDYFAVAGARKAVTDYRERHGIVEPILNIDDVGAFWRKRN